MIVQSGSRFVRGAMALGLALSTMVTPDAFGVPGQFGPPFVAAGSQTNVGVRVQTPNTRVGVNVAAGGSHGGQIGGPGGHHGRVAAGGRCGSRCGQRAGCRRGCRRMRVRARCGGGGCRGGGQMAFQGGGCQSQGQCGMPSMRRFASISISIRAGGGGGGCRRRCF